jgi:hypothetical protein
MRTGKLDKLALFVTKRKLGLLTIKLRNLAPYLSTGTKLRLLWNNFPKN